MPEALTFDGPVSWVYNTPNGQVLNGTNPAWYTGGNGGTYYEDEQSYVNGPCFNLDALERPMIALDLHYSTINLGTADFIEMDSKFSTINVKTITGIRREANIHIRS